MDKVLYLVHMTNRDPRSWTEVRVSEFDLYQFPGAYFSLITVDNVDKEDVGGNYAPTASPYMMRFSKTLLLQKNYHFNLIDYNGFISETNTYFPWNIEDGINVIPFQPRFRNEIVFHDSVPMRFCIDIKIQSTLPRTEGVPRGIPDMTKIPFYAFCFEQNYSGIDPLPLSSIHFFVRMAKLCRIKNIPSTIGLIVKQIKLLAPYLHLYRQEQDIHFMHTAIQNRPAAAS